jgi:tRNA A37 threonylcarbamoyladenosine dehydratase
MQMSTHGRFDRLELLFGADDVAGLKQASVAVFGLGGVGSYAVEALVRGGIGQLTLVDFDAIDITNCNRQIHAQEATIGQPKALVMAERCRSINPEVQVEAVQAFYNAESSTELLSPGFDYVLDCIDNITAKLHLIETCVKERLPIISSMGAANKLDPTCILVADLAKTHKCRLARILRRELRRRGISRGVKTVYSTEEFRPLSGGRRTGTDDEIGNYQARRAPLGSSSVVPPLFGLTMAGVVLHELLERKMA